MDKKEYTEPDHDGKEMHIPDDEKKKAARWLNRRSIDQFLDKVKRKNTEKNKNDSVKIQRGRDELK